MEPRIMKIYAIFLIIYYLKSIKSYSNNPSHSILDNNSCHQFFNLNLVITVSKDENEMFYKLKMLPVIDLALEYLESIPLIKTSEENFIILKQNFTELNTFLTFWSFRKTHPLFLNVNCNNSLQKIYNLKFSKVLVNIDKPRSIAPISDKISAKAVLENLDFVGVLKNYTIPDTLKEDCNPEHVAGQLLDLYFNFKVKEVIDGGINNFSHPNSIHSPNIMKEISFIIGPPCSGDMAVVGPIAAYYSIPTCTGYSIYDLDLSKYSTLTRLSYNADVQVTILIKLLKRFGHRNLVLIYDILHERITYAIDILLVTVKRDPFFLDIFTILFNSKLGVDPIDYMLQAKNKTRGRL
ncbi:unnamed protein product [Gordionus sp. m RMFG-2023]